MTERTNDEASPSDPQTANVDAGSNLETTAARVVDLHPQLRPVGLAADHSRDVFEQAASYQPGATEPGAGVAGMTCAAARYPHSISSAAR